MTTTFAPKAKNFTADADGMHAPCRGANHRDSGRIGHCDSCGAEVVEVVKSDSAYLTPLAHSNRGGRVCWCWNVHHCDADQVATHTARKAALLASGVVVKGCTVEVYKGRTVAIGTTGTVIWMGIDNWDKPRIGIKTTSGDTHFLAESNVRVIES
jgi:hypothetical protein